ncbi:bifunctional diaminohydroxyphosphoribosylaminopyrimidine deaminase/5-amino-6-(5-phosphoribosylamino)uracil reductase RibD [soil metagenome]
MASPPEIAAMRAALESARAVRRTLPNPRVGCVLLTPDGEEISRGVHMGAGSNHAEIDALVKAQLSTQGATAVVTLEPCNHFGRTGPCAQALIRAGVARVVYAQSDPNPVAAGGAEALRAAGVEVESGLMGEEATILNREWTQSIITGRPFVTWKYAATLDGLSAAPDGTSKWITGQPARLDVQKFRAEADAIMAGTGSVLADDPRLTVRDADDNPLPYDQQPLRVIVGETDIPDRYRIFDQTAPTLHIRNRDPIKVLRELHDLDIRHVWLEGGPRLAGAFWNAGMIDRVIGYIAPSLLGAGQAALEGAATTLADIGTLDIEDLTMIGRDIRIIARPLSYPRQEFR